MEIKNLEKLPESVKDNLKKYCEEIIDIHKKEGNLEAVFVYGSVLTSDFNPKNSNINLLFVFKEVGPSVLKKSIKIVHWGKKHRIAIPLFITQKEMDSSTDVFPMEFLDIKENHILLWGKDVLSSLEISQGNLRLQVEQELRGKVLKLRQAYLEIGLEKDGAGNLILNTFSSFFPVFRNILRLKGVVPLVHKEKIITKLSEIFSLNKGIFLAILDRKQGRAPHFPKNDAEFFSEYMQELERIVAIIDKL